MSARPRTIERPMAPQLQRYDDASSHASSEDYEDSRFSYTTDSRLTDHTSCRSWEPLQRMQKQKEPEDIPPTVIVIDSTASPNASAQSVDSAFLGSESADEAGYDDDEHLPSTTEDDIPRHLPTYRASVIDPAVRPSDPDSFERLFPSLDRLSIRHDDLTSDGNMNLRVDTVVPRSNGHRPITMQLFHLRMYDLARRNFALRRYCRESGREVCNSKRAYAEPLAASRPGLQRSVSSALHSFKNHFRRPSSSSIGSGRRPSTGYSSSSSWDNTSARSTPRDSLSSDRQPPPAAVLVPTNSIKLEFSNYARVDIERKGTGKSLRYEFGWWGHTYTWKLVHDKELDTVSFHLSRDGNSQPVAHITPEPRSPNQIEDEEHAGGWIPPYHMWICDESVLTAQVDIADVIVASGLIALVDDCIKTRWQNKKVRQPIKSGSVEHLEVDNPLRPFRGFFHRRYSEQPSTKSIRTSRPVAVY